jgi:hypothetical protein
MPLVGGDSSSGGIVMTLQVAAVAGSMRKVLVLVTVAEFHVTDFGGFDPTTGLG